MRSEIEMRARELLAEEYRKAGKTAWAESVESNDIAESEHYAILAIRAALAARQPVGQKPVCSIDPRHLFLMKGRDGTLSGNVLRFGASMQPGDAALYTAPPQAPAAAVLQESELRVIESLLGLAYEAWNLADNTEDAGDTDLSVQRADFDSLSARLDELDELPDDQPGYTMEAAAKARWALRRVLAAAPPPGVR